MSSFPSFSRNISSSVGHKIAKPFKYSPAIIYPVFATSLCLISVYAFHFVTILLLTLILFLHLIIPLHFCYCSLCNMARLLYCWVLQYLFQSITASCISHAYCSLASSQYCFDRYFIIQLLCHQHWRCRVRANP